MLKDSQCKNQKNKIALGWIKGNTLVTLSKMRCGILDVNNSVEDGSDDARDRDFKGFHRVVGLDQILSVVTSESHQLQGKTTISGTSLSNRIDPRLRRRFSSSRYN